MDNVFSFSKEKVAETVKEMSELMNCNYEIAYKKYTHDLVKMSASWEEAKEILDK